MIYVTLGREVFRFPKDDLAFVGTIETVSTTDPPAPNPADPFGCPDNPARATSFAFVIRYPDPANNRLNPMIEAFELFQARPDFWGLQTSDVKIAQDWCDRIDTTRSTISEDLEQCRLPSPGAKPGEQGGALRADSRRYSAPFDRPFVALCTHAILTSCEVHYKYLLTVNLRYRFTLSKLPPSQLIAFDQALRSKLGAARQPDYPWTNE